MNRKIDSVLHELSSPQILEQLIRMFKADSKEPVVFYCERGVGREELRHIRIELIRLRDRRKKNGEPYSVFGFTSEGPFYVKFDDMVREAFALQFRMTATQRMRNASIRNLVEF